MSTLADYIKKYGDLDFTEKGFTEADNLIFSMLAYLDFSKTSVDRGTFTLSDIAAEYFKKNSYKKVAKLGFSIGDAYKLLEMAAKTRRFGDVPVSDYVYISNRNIQFGAVTFEFLPKMHFVAFEGTDEQISGWREDFRLSVEYPVPAQQKAAEYLWKHTRLGDADVIVGGHSKGGNLALAACLELPSYKLAKVLQIYNNDGPGLRRRELHSFKYIRLRHKYYHVVPENSVFGVLFRNDKYIVVKNSIKGLRGHSAFGWLLKDGKLLRGKLSEKSRAFEKSMLEWLNKHSYEERVRVINAIFGALERNKVNDTMTLKRPLTIIRVIRSIRSVDEETKNLISDLVRFNYENVKKVK